MTQVTECTALAVRFRNTLPQFTACFGTAVTDDKGDDLACLPTESHPKPSFLMPLTDKTSKFIQFKHVIWLDWLN